MSFTVIRQGLFDTIQDQGRPLQASKGIPVSGVMDEYLSGIANLLVGKNENSACIEMLKLGAKIKFTQDNLVAVTALSADVYLDSKPVSLNEAFEVKAGQELDIQKIKKGNFAYLAFGGDIQVKTTAGSKSFHSSLSKNSRLQKNETYQINVTERFSSVDNYAQLKVNSQYYKGDIIRVFTGAEFDLLTKENQELLFDKTWQLSGNLTRMAFQLESTIKHQIEEILTSAVFPGTVQLNHSGELTILMKDAQTTGGYPRVLQVIDEDLKKLAQKQTGEAICFQRIQPD